MSLSAFFFAGLFDLGFLSEVATASFTRLVIGVCTAFFSFGLLLTRVYAAKYVGLAELPAPDAYRRTVVVDHVFLFSLPMWIVAFVTILLGHALFPSETDFRVLGPLPISRRLVFHAKVRALCRFIGLFIVSVEIALLPLLITMSVSRWAEGLFVARMAAALIASVAACVLCVLLISAWQAALRLCASHARAADMNTISRSAALCFLMMCLPLIGRIPAQPAAPLLEGRGWWWLVPPAWFVGLERWLLGDTQPVMRHFAMGAAGALIVGAVFVISSYALLYRHFERLTVQSKAPAGTARTRALPISARPLLDGIRHFVVVTLRRSGLHQSVTVVIAAIGAGLGVNSLIGHDVAGWMLTHRAPTPAVVGALLWAPLSFVYASARAIRLAFLLPLEPRANWIFRLTEQEALRLDQTEAAIRTMFVLGAVVPILVVLPLQITLLGAPALATASTTAAWSYVYVEMLMRDWARLPFTCSYIPGKRFVPQKILVGTALFLFFTLAGEALAWSALRLQPLSVCLVVGVLFAAVALRQHRRHFSRLTPLQFEDSLPAELFPLKLGPS